MINLNLLVCNENKQCHIMPHFKFFAFKKLKQPLSTALHEGHEDKIKKLRYLLYFDLTFF